jgi:hypothetical protein
MPGSRNRSFLWQKITEVEALYTLQQHQEHTKCAACSYAAVLM